MAEYQYDDTLTLGELKGNTQIVEWLRVLNPQEKFTAIFQMDRKVLEAFAKQILEQHTLLICPRGDCPHGENNVCQLSENELAIMEDKDGETQVICEVWKNLPYPTETDEHD